VIGIAGFASAALPACGARGCDHSKECGDRLE
jgi:hypothetical protein